MPDSLHNPLLQYLARLAPSSQLTMKYVLQDAADRLGFIDCNLAEVPWHLLEPGHVIGLVAALRADGYAPNSSSLYVNAVRGVMNEAWRQGLIDHEQLLRIREVKPSSGQSARGAIAVNVMPIFAQPIISEFPMLLRASPTKQR